MRIRIEQTADWHGFPLGKVELIAKLVLKALNSPIQKPPCDSWPREVLITNGSPVPMVECGPEEIVRIRVALNGFYPVQLCYKFAHEWGHVLSNNWRSYNPGSFHWLEESICGSLSLYALVDAKKSWSKKPSLKQYVSSIADYVNKSDEGESPLSSGGIPDWASANDVALRSMQRLEKLNSRLSFPLLDTVCSSPIVIRSLQARNRSSCHEVDLADHLRRWAEQCRALRISDRFPCELALLFGVQISWTLQRLAWIIRSQS